MVVGTVASTVLFVHGAHLGGWCWLLVMDRLASRGIRAEAIDLPFTGYEDDVRCVRDAVEAAGGTVRSTSSATATPAFRCAPAGTSPRTSPSWPAACRCPASRRPRLTPEWGFADFQRCMTTDAEGVTTVTRAVRPYFFHRCPPSLAELALDRLRPMRSAVPQEPLVDPAWRRVPSSYVVCTDDRAVQPAAQRDRARAWAPRSSSIPTTARSSSNPALLAQFIVAQHDAAMAA